jgi:hypothetical protein
VTARSVRHSRRRWRSSLAHSSCAIAHRRGPLPAAPTPRTRPQRAPAVTRRGSRALRAGRTGRHAQMGRSPGEGSQRRAGTPRIVQAGPSSVKGTPRSFLTASQKRSLGPTLERRSLCQPSGPGGEGPAKGLARTHAANLQKKPSSPARSGTRRGGRERYRSVMEVREPCPWSKLSDAHDQVARCRLPRLPRLLISAICICRKFCRIHSRARSSLAVGTGPTGVLSFFARTGRTPVHSRWLSLLTLLDHPVHFANTNICAAICVILPSTILENMHWKMRCNLHQVDKMPSDLR